MVGVDHAGRPSVDDVALTLTRTRLTAPKGKGKGEGEESGSALLTCLRSGSGCPATTSTGREPGWRSG